MATATVHHFGSKPGLQGGLRRTVLVLDYADGEGMDKHPTPADHVSLGTIAGVAFAGGNPAALEAGAVWDATNQCLQVYDRNSGVEWSYPQTLGAAFQWAMIIDHY